MPAWVVASFLRTAAMSTEQMIRFTAPITLDPEFVKARPEVVDAWSVTGEADAIARVRTQDNADLERLIMALQRDGLVQRTRSQVVLSQLVGRPRPHG